MKIKYIPQLTFSRFIAAIAVFFFHFSVSYYDLGEEDRLTFIIEKFNMAVPYFFLFSGFILTYVYQNRPKISFLHFILSRLSRIYPLYLLALVIDTFIKYKLWGVSINLDDLLLNATLIQSWFGDKQLTCNGPGWSLSVEFFLYCSFPFIFNHLLSKKSLKTPIVVCTTIWIICQITHITLLESIGNNDKYWFSVIHYNPIFHLGNFMIGCLAALILIKKDTFLTQINIQSIFFSIIPIGILILLMAIKHPIIKYHHNGLFSPLILVSILSFSLNTGKISNVISKRGFVYLGKISFGIYILQYPALYIIRYIQDKFSPPYINDMFLYYHLTTLIILSITFYHLIEVPAQTFFRKLIEKSYSNN